MRRLGLDDLDREAVAFDRAAAATDGVDAFCSSSAWVLPAAEALMTPGAPIVLRDGEAWAAFAVRDHGERVLCEPLELAWALASPLVGGPPVALAELAAAAIATARADLTVIAGVVEGSPLWDALLARLGGRHRLGRGPETRRHRASLAGGVDGFLARRPRELRKALRRAAARAREAGVRFEHHAPRGSAAAAALYDRALAVEAASWKGREGTGLADPGMAAFYRAMLGRLAARGDARVTLATRPGDGGERDVGFVLGARWGTLYRGLQFGFAESERALGLGNLAQLEVVAELVAEGVETYDLGTGGEYKTRWAEHVLDTVAIVVASR